MVLPDAFFRGRHLALGFSLHQYRRCAVATVLFGVVFVSVVLPDVFFMVVVLLSVLGFSSHQYRRCAVATVLFGVVFVVSGIARCVFRGRHLTVSVGFFVAQYRRCAVATVLFGVNFVVSGIASLVVGGVLGIIVAIVILRIAGVFSRRGFIARLFFPESFFVVVVCYCQPYFLSSSFCRIIVASFFFMWLQHRRVSKCRVPAFFGAL